MKNLKESIPNEGYKALSAIVQSKNIEDFFFLTSNVDPIIEKSSNLFFFQLSNFNSKLKI